MATRSIATPAPSEIDERAGEAARVDVSTLQDAAGTAAEDFANLHTHAGWIEAALWSAKESEESSPNSQHTTALRELALHLACTLGQLAVDAGVRQVSYHNAAAVTLGAKVWTAKDAFLPDVKIPTYQPMRTKQ